MHDMPSPVNRRIYNATKRQASSLETKVRILAAAREVMVESGYRGATVAQLGRILRRMFPVTVGAGIDHAWCGVLGVPRDWCATVTLDPRTGLGWAGGYTGHGVAAANLAGRTLADLVRGVPSPLTTLPWVGHRSPRWEPEPARWAGVRGLYALYRAADRLESAGGSPRTSLLAQAGDVISGISR